MSKYFKEKYEKVCDIKDKALCLVDAQINGDISSVDAKELGEVADIAKDMAELMKYCAEAEYYHKVVESMESSTDEENSCYLNKYTPEYGGKFYTPIMFKKPEYYIDPYMKHSDDEYKHRMYYSSMDDSKMNRDYREGKSPMIRRTYMEMREHGEDKDKVAKELEHYMNELSSDMTEMIQGMDANDKTMLKQKLATLASKIV